MIVLLFIAAIHCQSYWKPVLDKLDVEQPWRLAEPSHNHSRLLADQNTLTNASFISFSSQSNASYEALAYKNVLTSPHRYSTNHILYPYYIKVPHKLGDMTYEDGAIITLPNTSLPIKGTSSYFDYLTTEGNVNFGKAKPLYDMNVGVLSFEVSQEGVTKELFYECTSYCSILSNKYSNCIRGSEWDSTTSDTRNNGKSFFVYLDWKDITTSNLLFTKDNDRRFGVLIIPDYLLGSEDMIATNLGTLGIQKIKDHIESGGIIIASGKSGYLLEKWGLLSVRTYITTSLISSIESTSKIIYKGCDNTTDDFDFRAICMNTKYTDSLYYSFGLSSFQMNSSASAQFDITLYFNDNYSYLKKKDSTSGEYQNITANDRLYMPFLLRKPIGKGKLFLVNGSPAYKATYKELLYNLMFIGMSKAVLFNVEIITKDNLPIPGGESGINVDSKIMAYNLFNESMTDFKIYIWLANYISFSNIPNNCVADSTNYTRFSYLANNTSINLTSLVVCSKPTLPSFTKEELKVKIEILDQQATQAMSDILLIYPVLYYKDKEVEVYQDYGGATTNAALAAVLRGTLNPDPSSFFPLKNKGCYADNVIQIENKENTEASEVDYVQLIPLISPAFDMSNQASVSRTLNFFNQYYVRYGYAFPFKELDSYDILDLQYLHGKGVVLVSEWDDPTKAGKIVRADIEDTLPSAENTSSISDFDIYNLNATLNIESVSYVIKQIYFKDADLFFELASQKQIPFIDTLTPNGFRTMYGNTPPAGIENPNKPGTAKWGYLWARQDIFFYDVNQYQLPYNISAKHMFTLERYPIVPGCVNTFGNANAVKTVNGHFSSNYSDGILVSQYSNELLMYCDRVVVNMSNPANTIAADTNGSIRLVSYLVPVYDAEVTHPTDIIGFVDDTNGNGHHATYPEIKFTYAHSMQVEISADLSRIGGMIEMIFPIDITNNSATFQADQVSFYSIVYDLAAKKITAYYNRGNMPNEAYGKPSIIGIAVKGISTAGSITLTSLKLYELKHDMSSIDTNYETFLLRNSSTSTTMSRSRFFELPAVEIHTKLNRTGKSILGAYESLDPFTRTGIYFQELLTHSTLWVLVESHHRSDPGLQTINTGQSLLSNLGISSIPFIEYLTVGSGQLIPYSPTTSRLEWKDIWGRHWSEPLRSIFVDVPPIPGPLRNFMMTTTFELTKSGKTERVFVWDSEEELDVRVHLKFYNNYPKYFQITTCLDNEVPFFQINNGNPHSRIFDAPPFAYQINTSLALTDMYHINYGSRNIYGICFDETGTILKGNVVTPQFLAIISTANLCADSLNETMIKQCIIERKAMNLPTVTKRESNFTGEKWIYSPKIERYYPNSYLSQDMFDMSVDGYDDTPMDKAFKYHMDNWLPNVDNSIIKPHNVICQPIFKGFGYNMTYSSNLTLARYPNYKGWWSDNLQNKDHTLVAGQNSSYNVSVDKDTLLPDSAWTNIKNLINPVADVVTWRLKNIYVCLYNQNRVKLNVSHTKYAYLSNVLQNNVVPIIPDLDRYDARLWSMGCSNQSQYSPYNISMVSNVVGTPTIRNWLYFSVNLRGNAYETLNIATRLSPLSSVKYEGLAKVQDGGRFTYWNPANGPNSFMVVDNSVNVVEAMRNDILLDCEIYPKQIATFNSYIYSLFTINEPSEDLKVWNYNTYINHYGFGDTTVSIFVGGTLGSKSIISEGETTYVKISFYNNAGFDWNMLFDGITFEGQPAKPAAAVFLLGWIKRAIQVPLKYNFMELSIPDEIKNYITIIPSDHNADVAPAFFDFNSINPVTIKDGFKGDYFYKITLKAGVPNKFKGKVLKIGVKLIESYFDHLPGYNDLTKTGYHDYHLQIPDIKIGIPYSTGPYVGKVYESWGYSTNLSMSMKIPITVSNIEFKTIRGEAIQTFKDAAADQENYQTLLKGIWDALENTSYTIKTVNFTGYNTYTVNCTTAIPTFPLKNDLTPNNATFYVLAKGLVKQIASGTNAMITSPYIYYQNFALKSKNCTIPAPISRSIPAYGAWLSVKYNYTVMMLDENGTLVQSDDQRVFSTDSGYLKVIVKLSNIGSATAYNTNFTLQLDNGTQLNTSLIDPTISVSGVSENYTLSTKRKIIVGEPYSENVYLTYNCPPARRDLADTTRSFIKSVSVSIDLTDSVGQSQVTQSIQTPMAISYNSGQRESITIIGTPNGSNFTNLTIMLNASISPAPTDLSPYIFKFSKKYSSVNCSNETEFNKIVAYKYWKDITILNTSSYINDTVFPSTFNATTLSTVSINYMVQAYKSGTLIATSTWSYGIVPAKYDLISALFPVWAIITIVVLSAITIGIIIFLVIRIKRLRKKQKMVPEADIKEGCTNIPITQEPIDKKIEAKLNESPEIAPKLIAEDITNSYASHSVLQEQSQALSIPLHETPNVDPTVLSGEPIADIASIPTRLYDYSYCDKDAIDTALYVELTEYMKENKGLLLPLRRIKNGVYMYGRMKINMVIANDKVLVRVGGGYMPVNEFLEYYTPIELAKLHKGDGKYQCK